MARHEYDFTTREGRDQFRKEHVERNALRLQIMDFRAKRNPNLVTVSFVERFKRFFSMQETLGHIARGLRKDE